MRVRFLSLLKQHQEFLLLYLFFLLVAFVIMAAVPKYELFLLVNRYYNSFFDVFFVAYTWAGDGWTMFLVAVGLVFVKYRYALLTILAYGYTSLFGWIIKRLMNEPRPFKYFENREPIRVIEGFDMHSWYSFPSGHSITAFALATVMAFLMPARYKKFTWILVLLAVLAGFSRVYLSQHFFQDIVAGSVIGVFFSFHMIWLLLNSKWYHSEKLEGRLFGGTR
ncbi:MAG TPA: phosphatase PAP2 family protein [Flavisolibacter sp.]